MKFVTATVLILSVNSVLSGREDDSVLKKAFEKLIGALVESSNDLSIVTVGDRVKTSILDQTQVTGVPFAVRNFNYRRFELNTSAIISVESFDELVKFNEKVFLTNNYSKPFQFFVHCNGAKVDMLAKLEENHKTKAIFQFEYFVVDEEEFIRLMTFVWYTETACRQPQLVEVNKFSKKGRKWEKESFRINKFENFHGCTVWFCFYTAALAFTRVLDPITHKVTSCDGYLCHAADAIAGNVNAEFSISSKDDRDLDDDRYDFFWIMDSLLTVSKGARRFLSQIFMSSDDQIAVPPPEAYNAYEKLLLPFDEPTWLWLVMTFSFLFGAVFVLRFTRKPVQGFVFGPKVETPALNVMRAFFGISQIQTPGRNFARFLLMLVIIFSLIVRTAYQGKMFEFLQKEMLKPQVESIREMIDQNYTFYVTKGFTTAFNKENYFGNCTVIEIVPEKYLQSAYNFHKRIGAKIALEIRRPIFMESLMTNNRLFTMIIRNERILRDMNGLVAQRHNKMFDFIDQKMQQLIEGGIFEHYTRYEKKLLDSNWLNEYRESFKVLTFDELEASFVVCFVPLLFCIVVFCCEWMIVLKDYIVYKCIFVAFLKVQTLNEQSKKDSFRVNALLEMVQGHENQVYPWIDRCNPQLTDR